MQFNYNFEQLSGINDEDVDEDVSISWVKKFKENTLKYVHYNDINRHNVNIGKKNRYRLSVLAKFMSKI